MDKETYGIHSHIPSKIIPTILLMMSLTHNMLSDDEND